MSFHFKDHVRSEWVDYNGHMNDAAYAAVFSHSVDKLMEYIGLDESARESYAYTIFTLETHLCYLKEARKDETIHVTVQLLDDDAKRLHVFYTMKNDAGEQLATSEQMLMGIDTDKGIPAPFPDTVANRIDSLRQEHEHLTQPKQVGRQIGIKR
ncbi:thioesterase family protein [Thalassobacillus pellis]|uniref:thioesterase family protein n=1 Tax=Thalassobacillus pellis TaxID=748008 RepID=UPI0019617254|nr:thioesterase family protein [Thalassobacillus pellis]MBM7551339.1 acyl-CoA thioester hydrolase [Thalassobacillus pellis]